MEVYLSGISNRTNEIMKVLTIISAVIMPKTLIAGIHGMNFNTRAQYPRAIPARNTRAQYPRAIPARNTRASSWNMPELEKPWGYLFALGVMMLVALVMLLCLRVKGWLGAPEKNLKP